MLCHHLIMELKRIRKKLPTLQAVIFFNISLWCCILLLCYLSFFPGEWFCPTAIYRFSVHSFFFWCVSCFWTHIKVTQYKWHDKAFENCQKAIVKRNGRNTKTESMKKRNIFTSEGTRKNIILYSWKEKQEEKNWIIKFCRRKWKEKKLESCSCFSFFPTIITVPWRCSWLFFLFIKAVADTYFAVYGENITARFIAWRVFEWDIFLFYQL